MEIKIELPPNVRVTCPNVDCAVAILRSISQPASSGLDDYEVVDADVELDESGFPNEGNRSYAGPPEAIGFRPAEGEGFNVHAGWEPSLEPDPDDEPDAEYLGDGPDTVSDEPKANTRSRHSASLVGGIFLPLEGIADERTRRLFDFVQTRLVFSTKDAQQFAEEEMGLHMSRKNRRRVRDALRTIRKAGFIEKAPHGDWRRVA